MNGALIATIKVKATSRRMAGPFVARRSQITPPRNSTAKTIKGGMGPAKTLINTMTRIDAIALHFRRLLHPDPGEATDDS